MPKNTKILIIGNGFGGVRALKNLHAFFKNDKTVEFSLIGRKNYFLFTPLLHEVATGGISPGNVTEPIRRVFGTYLNNFYLGKAKKIILKNHTVEIGGAMISYDYLVLAPGAETNFYGIPGAEQYSFPLKSIEDAIKIKNHCITQMEHASLSNNKDERKRMLKFVVIGGGPTGVELTAELEELVKESFSHYYPKEIIEDVSITLIQRGAELVPQFGTKIRKKSLETLQKKGVDVLLKTGVKEISASYAILDNDSKIFTETVIWVGGVKPAELNFEEAVPKTPDGKVLVNEYLQIKEYPEVFVIGDAAAFKQEGSDNFLPALAQVAEKESETVAKNIKLLMSGSPLEKFYYKSSGNLMSLGRWMAVGEIGGFSFSGHFAWWIWRTVYLSKLISLRKKMKVAIDWTMNIFSPRDISQI